MKPRPNLSQNDQEPVTKIMVVKEYVVERPAQYPLFEFEIGRLQIAEIIELVATYFGVTVLDIFSHRRGSIVTFARHVVFYLCRHLTPLSLPQIARRIGDRDHTTIMHGSHRIEKLIKTDEKLAADIATLKEMLTL
jgi:chromosomal replication initiation ATPase DnaA